jgi:hypothetical protein
MHTPSIVICIIQVHLYTEADAIYICGDLNSRIGRLDDYINDVDDIPSRVALDGFVNHPGENPIRIPSGL